MKLAVLFSGQGAQFAGMGLDFIEKIPVLKNKLDSYCQMLELDLFNLLSNQELINDTRYTQPLMVVVEMLIHDYLVSIGLKPKGYTGFSLGEYTALYASKIFSDEDILKIINKRAELMQKASSKYPGSMAAILQLDDSIIEDLCKRISSNEKFLVPANYNAPGQLVISGDKTLIELATIEAKNLGAKRAMILNVSGAFHSPYMKEAGELLEIFAKAFKVNEPVVPVYKNTDASVLKQQDVFQEIKNQVQMPVYFKQSIEQMVNDGFDTFLEIGPGNVLFNLVKKINPNLNVYNVSRYEDLDKIKEILI
ncbi:Malonyl CoA-acyl carrier protein transacylase [Acholeplasma oculi]|uniref:Malonyl CoA-acyl carrier protein transacylase n=1 Tax=Acholeplasma oculi TaxID=35623 RepID=A0A061AI91_9MOLU|nr:ACP S-malonyltransferase [Acholeplasma oculi]CDR30677.1 Malonyl CoA-acyl carrier protein transacylase [Acholeplasma oculi]SKC34640.1 [acyl-carrier-protein] S-malonyltransferase [Acholeplasma oculi]SUT89469.1 Malonyl CoA-acyl carrier protein transacylase [Acholeplasma oculi]